jgi:tRNA threonylcarbamoyladenosine biosynthesis protein TsaB
VHAYRETACNKTAALNPKLQLAIDTSSRLTSLYVALGDDVLGTLAVRMSDRRSERLWSQIDFLLKEAGLRIDEVDLFSVCTGPGGFTGIRVGMAAAKGLAMAAGRPLIGVTSLEATVAAAGHAPAILAMTRAREGEVFSQLFRYEALEAPLPADAPLVSSPREALERVVRIGELVIIGEGAADNADLIAGYAANKSGRRRRQWILGPRPQVLAPLIAQVALIKVSAGDRGEAADVKACYVRPAEAETKLALGLVGPGLRP